MSTLLICPDVKSYAKCFYELVALLEKPEDFMARCRDYEWEMAEGLQWAPARDFSIAETDDFSLNLNFSFPPDEPNFAFAGLCGITYYDEDTDTELSETEARELDAAFDQAYFNFLEQMESELGRPSRNGTYEIDDRTLRYASWEQASGLLILNQTMGDVYCGIDWEIHVSLFPWKAGQDYPGFLLLLNL